MVEPLLQVLKKFLVACKERSKKSPGRLSTMVRFQRVGQGGLHTTLQFPRNFSAVFPQFSAIFLQFFAIGLDPP